jgi:hypothetical protein
VAASGTPLEKAALDPDYYLTRLATSDDYKLRVGDYRVLAVLSHSARRFWWNESITVLEFTAGDGDPVG